MGTDEHDSDHHASSEIQALMCNEVLRDWLRHLESDAEETRRLPEDRPTPQREWMG
ncbi:MAG: hypothetical protein ACLFSC_11225 [Wenzhouxiangella sp.]